MYEITYALYHPECRGHRVTTVIVSADNAMDAMAFVKASDPGFGKGISVTKLDKGTVVFIKGN